MDLSNLKHVKAVLPGFNLLTFYHFELSWLDNQYPTPVVHIEAMFFLHFPVPQTLLPVLVAKLSDPLWRTRIQLVAK